MRTLLLADDNLVVQRMVAMTFAAENIAVTTVDDGEQAIARIAQDPPDIVLAGIATPKRSGYDVAAFVKSAPEFASIPVLLLAGAFEPVDRQRAEEVRCAGVLVKPFEPQQMVARVKELIGARETAEAVVAPQTASPLAPPAGQEPPRDPQPAPVEARDEALDEYFDRLDAAFANRVPVAPAPPSPETVQVPTLEKLLESAAPPASAGEPASRDTPAAAPAVTDAFVEEITRRVVERLGTPAVHAVVAEVVADVAERLVRAEIARIRNRA